MLSLNAEKRDVAIRPEKIRKAGKLPAVYYGPKEASTPIAVPMAEFKKIWKKAGESSVIILKDGASEHEVLIHGVDPHPVSGEPRHADFYVIEKGKKVQVKVPIVFSGTAPAVKDKGGILVKVLREIEVEAAPKDLPREIVADISALAELTDIIHLSDIRAPEGVEFKLGADEVIASVSEAKEEVVEAPAPIDMSAIEVEGKGGEAKEGEARPAAGTAGAAGAAPKPGEPKAAEGKKEERKPAEKR
ncbi:MAG: 50S ribosomal protein L25 [Minisyncoccia bacterium]|jgi:large subunit ribosomal protein L25